ncbi:MAG: 30S ribosomal protein S12 methylthiotransferase RimO [bacterium]
MSGQGIKGTVKIITLGCAKNEVDSEEIAGVLRQEGFVLDGTASRPDVIVINTCGFLEAAKREALAVIKDAIQDKKRGKTKKVIVAGCLPQRLGEALVKDLPEVDAFIGVGQMSRFGEIVGNTLGLTQRLIDIQAPHHRWADVGTRARAGAPWSAYLKISEGCDHECTFCTIPSFRGPHISKPMERILEEARLLASEGTQEINLIAQDSSQYGHDYYQRLMLPDLLRDLSRIEGLHWIRPLYCYPTRVSDALIDTLASLPNTCHYFDIPLQHADKEVLRAMKRPGDAQTYLKLLERMRLAMPDVAIRTTFIVGFPGETEEQFNRLLEFIKDANFDRAGAFLYSAESGTPSAEMPNQVPQRLKRERYSQVMQLQQKISLAKNKEWEGRVMEVLIEARSAKSPNYSIGRSYRDAPEIDGQVFIKDCAAPLGTFIKAKITQAAEYDLFAEMA